MEKLKEFSLPFTLYDFFGYFLPGFFFLLIWIIEYDAGDLMDFYVNNVDDPNSLKGLDARVTSKLKFKLLDNFINDKDGSFRFVPFFILIVFVYLVGHIIAAISSFFLEKFIVFTFVGYPSVRLLDTDYQERKRKLLSFRARPLEINFIKEFKEVVDKRFGASTDVSNYYWLCFSDICRYAPIGFRRVVHFLNLYGFARNVCMCFLLYIIFRVCILWFFLDSDLSMYNWVILGIYLVVAFILFYNYNKLFVMQCKELYYHFYSIHKSNHLDSKNPVYNYTMQVE